jgi:hypothetical protein
VKAEYAVPKAFLRILGVKTKPTNVFCFSRCTTKFIFVDNQIHFCGFAGRMMRQAGSKSTFAG